MSDLQAVEEWCAKQCAKLSDEASAHIMSGGDMNDPTYRSMLGQSQAFMRVRSFIHGAKDERCP